MSITLSELIKDLRTELNHALVQAEDQTLRFTLNKVEIQVQVKVESKVDGKAGVKFWVVEASAGGGLSKGETHTITLSLTPHLPDGPVNVSSKCD